MRFIKRLIEKSEYNRYQKFLSEYKRYSDELLWDWYCGLDMDEICNTSIKYDNQMYTLVEKELEKRNNPKYPVRRW